jgi:RecA-family ATPase
LDCKWQELSAFSLYIYKRRLQKKYRDHKARKANLKAVMASERYQHLRSRCPSVIEDLLRKLAP